MLSIVQSGTLLGVNAHPVHIEVNAKEFGDPRIYMVGLPDTAVKESTDRVFSALVNSNFKPPRYATTINLAPGDLKKEGPLFDLPIAIAMLAASNQIKPERVMHELPNYIIAGELSLSGETRSIKGGLSIAILAKKMGLKNVMLPPKSAHEAALVQGVNVYSVRNLDEATRFLNGECLLEPLNCDCYQFNESKEDVEVLDFAEVKGQYALRRAVEIAVAGGHNLLMIGPPGSGKSMIAKRIPTIMPEPSLDEFLEIVAVHSAAGRQMGDAQCRFKRPYRSPHHTISDVGLIGGGSIPKPGEISLAHNGVLFLDELPEFKRSTLEVLRQPLEDKEVTISRSAAKVTLPASIMLVAAMNPTPSGYTNKDGRENSASPAQIQRYRSRISGPLLDRIDIHVEAPALSFEELRSPKPGEPSQAMRERIGEARQLQTDRFPKRRGANNRCNANMSHADIRQHCKISTAQGNLLQQAMEELKLSARAYDRILKVARTIADLAQANAIENAHLLEAIHYRNLDRELFY